MGALLSFPINVAISIAELILIMKLMLGLRQHLLYSQHGGRPLIDPSDYEISKAFNTYPKPPLAIRQLHETNMITHAVGNSLLPSCDNNQH